MKCSNCLHNDACGGYIPSDMDNEEVLEMCAKGLQDEIPDIEDICSEFIDSSKYAEIQYAKWEVYRPQNSDKKFIRCTNCDATIDCTDTHIDENEYDWCPYCGAKIIKEG